MTRPGQPPVRSGTTLGRADRRLVLHLARGALAEVAPNELSLFDQAGAAFYRWPPRHLGDDKLGSDLGSLAGVTDAAIVAAQAVVVLALTGLTDALNRKASSSAEGWFRRWRHRSAPADAASAEADDTGKLAGTRSKPAPPPGITADVIYRAAFDALAGMGLEAATRQLVARAIVGQVALLLALPAGGAADVDEVSDVDIAEGD
jgi:hypothetical protein